MSAETVAITGANRGIGLALARRYRQRDARVIALCRQASQALGSIGAEVMEGVEVTSPTALQAAAREVGGTIDVLIANAGVLTDETFDEIADSDALTRVRHQFEVNALGPLLTVHAFADHLPNGSKVATITSRMGSIADNSSGGRYGYRMSKAALNAAARSMALDLKARGIALAILHPGYVRTDMTAGSGQVDPEDAATMLIERIDALDLDHTGTFWHANGEVLPW